MTQDSALELMRQNAELAARVAELTQALAQAEAFTKLNAGVVHDLRNAFQVTLMAAETLVVAVQEPDDRELAESIVAAAQHGALLARDLLAVAGRDGSRPSSVDTAECLERLRRFIQRFALQKIECSFEIEPEVWPIMVERQKLDAALINLCVNARDAMPRGGRLVVVVRNLREDDSLPSELSRGDYVEFSITDTGFGMPPSVLARATEAFFTTKETTGGTGLGLAMVHTFASRSGGAVSIESEPDRGTTVKIVLPRAHAPSETVDADPEARAKLESILLAIRTPELRHALQEWRALCPADGLPRPIATESRLASHSEHLLVLQVEPGASRPSLRLVRIGDALERALGRTKLTDFSSEGSNSVGSFSAAYRRALHSRFPSYEYAKYAFSDGEPEVFERLILPTARDGKVVSHLLGIVHLPESLKLESETNHVETE